MTKISVYDVYKQDQEYQAFMSEFNRKKARFEEMANQGIYNKAHLQEVAKKLHGDLQKFLLDHKNKHIQQRQERMESLENKKQKFGLVERSAEVEEFKMRFKLANDHELKRMVENLKTTDLLEINLLRMELKSRGLDKLDGSGNSYDAKVKNYIVKNQLDGMDADEKKEYERLQEEATIYRSIGTGFVVGESSFKHLQGIQQELNQTANKVVNNKAIVRDININQF